MKNKKFFWFGFFLILVAFVTAAPVRAQELDIPGSETVWEAVKGVMSDPWAIFEPLEGFQPAGVDFYSWTQKARSFIGEFQNALTVSPQEAFNLVLGKSSGVIWLDTLVNFIKTSIQKLIY